MSEVHLFINKNLWIKSKYFKRGHKYISYMYDLLGSFKGNTQV